MAFLGTEVTVEGARVSRELVALKKAIQQNTETLRREESATEEQLRIRYKPIIDVVDAQSAETRNLLESMGDAINAQSAVVANMLELLKRLTP